MCAPPTRTWAKGETRAGMQTWGAEQERVDRSAETVDRAVMPIEVGHAAAETGRDLVLTRKLPTVHIAGRQVRPHVE